MDDKNRRRVLAVVALVISGGVFAYLAFGGIGSNLVYYWSPTELHEAGTKAQGATIRLGGLVAPGSIIRSDDNNTLEFGVTDGDQTVLVRATAVPPAMFREGIGVVIEGSVGKDGVFETHRLMIKHDNEYQAPNSHDDRDMKELMKTLQFESADT